MLSLLFSTAHHKKKENTKKDFENFYQMKKKSVCLIVKFHLRIFLYFIC